MPNLVVKKLNNTNLMAIKICSEYKIKQILNDMIKYSYYIMQWINVIIGN